VIHAILGNKLAPTEDPLTSTVWGLLELLPTRVLGDWLRTARPWGAMREPLELSPDAAVELRFWPRTRRHGEPDLLLLATADGRVDAVVIEAKYGAGKSQWHGPEALEEEAMDPKHDQLVRYWSALFAADFVGVDAARLRGARRTVVFLTADPSPPRAELDESVRLHPSIRLAWLAWADLDGVLARAAPQGRAERRVVEALRALLAHLGLTSFAGFRQPAMAAPVDDARLWRLRPGPFVGAMDRTVRALPGWRFEG
jgi:hypothetical protein